MQTKKILHRLLKKPSFTTKDATTLGMSSSALAYYVKLGLVERVSRGVYRNTKIENTAPFEWQDLLEISQSIPNGTICLISALAYYDLTLEIPRQFWIAIPHEARDCKRSNTRIVRSRNFNLGRISLNVGEYRTYIFDKERCVLDAFKKFGRETGMDSLKAYLRRTKEHKPDLPKLARYAKDLRVNITPYLEALT